MELLEPIEGDRAAGPEDYFHALTDYETPLDKYLGAKLGQGWRNSWAGQIATAKSLPDNALFRIGGEPVKAVQKLIPEPDRKPGASAVMPKSQATEDVIQARLDALAPDQRAIVLPQVEQELKQRGFKFYTEAEWRASEHYRDMPFEPFMTPERAKAKAAVFDNNRIRDWLIEHRPDGVVSGTLGFLANTVGGLADPTTAAGLGIGGKLVMNLGRTGLANLVKAGGIGALDGGISSLAHDYSLKQPLAKWGEHHSDREIWENAGWASLFGAGLGTVGQGARMLRAKPREPAGGGGIGTKLNEQLDSSKGTPKFSDFVLGEREPPRGYTTQGEPIKGRLIVQGISAPRKLVEHFNTRVSWFKQQLDDIADGVEGAVKYGNGPRVKDMPRALEKIADGRSTQTLSDLMAGRVLVESGNAAETVIQRLSQRFRILDVENFLDKPKEGYRGIHVQVDLGNGTSAEVQIMPKIFIDSGSFKRSHDIYEQLRVLTPEQRRPELVRTLSTQLEASIKEMEDDWLKVKDRF